MREVFEVVKDALLALGPFGMFVIAMLDSSLLSIPEINDILVVTRVIREPRNIIHWPLLAALGSVVGCLLLYSLAKKGGDAFLRKRFSTEGVKRVERFYTKFGVFALIIPALWPPPLPFKIFVATAGALGFPRKRFVLTVFAARAVRYYSEGVLAIFYGRQIFDYMKQHLLMVVLIIVAFIVLGLILYRVAHHLLFKKEEPGPAAPVAEEETYSG
jgi:membrane protein YqaA with SNARE-associated domain